MYPPYHTGKSVPRPSKPRPLPRQPEILWSVNRHGREARYIFCPASQLCRRTVGRSELTAWYNSLHCTGNSYWSQRPWCRLSFHRNFGLYKLGYHKLRMTYAWNWASGNASTVDTPGNLHFYFSLNVLKTPHAGPPRCPGEPIQIQRECPIVFALLHPIFPGQPSTQNVDKYLVADHQVGLIFTRILTDRPIIGEK